jgi:hypothetical protein
MFPKSIHRTTDLFRQFMDNPSFKKRLGDTIFNETYKKEAA